ncbi:MAG: peptidoglycan DD-metalloendopeptidase family protein [Pseudomonadota bacterium]
MELRPILRLGGLISLALVVAACTPKRSDKAEIEIRSGGSAPAASGGALGPQVTDLGDGIRDYGEYQAVVAGPGETVGAVAQRIGLSAAELGAYNGLPPSHQLRDGDELVLPPRPGGYGTQVAAADSGGTLSDGAAPSIIATPLDGGTTGGTVSDPTAEDGWSPDLAEQAIARATGIQDDGSLAAPPSANDPLPPEPTTPAPLESPDLRQYQTAPQAKPQPPQSGEEQGTVIAKVAPAETQAATAEPVETQVATAPSQQPVPLTGARFQRPVEGPIAIGYRQGSGGTRNDGVDFAAPPGAPVVAADDGEVALVSESLGGLGTIVLLRHSDGLLTVYGRVDNVSLNKGALVSRGQKIGEVATPPSGGEARMHFEVRRGAESLDPTPFLAG